MTTTDDRPGPTSVWLPENCPKWCEGGHAQCLAEGNPLEDAQLHYLAGGGGALDEICNQVDHRVMRPGGGSWNLHAEQRPMYPSGLLTVETINLVIDGPGRGGEFDLKLTTGEARVLARQLVALADRLDLA